MGLPGHQNIYYPFGSTKTPCSWHAKVIVDCTVEEQDKLGLTNHYLDVAHNTSVFTLYRGVGSFAMCEG